eukprot:SAG31_NODE_1452_length_8286_cov_6.329547_7_plen_102_part_00
MDCTLRLWARVALGRGELREPSSQRPAEAFRHKCGRVRAWHRRRPASAAHGVGWRCARRIVRSRGRAAHRVRGAAGEERGREQQTCPGGGKVGGLGGTEGR